MQTRPLGRTGINVSLYCLGSMTWGTQNSEAEGHAQIDAALDAGINFIDTAEMYPTTPLSAGTQGRTEEIIGTWFVKTGRRDDVVIATKVIGDGYDRIREGGPISPTTIDAAVESSLRRLQTDYIDLYQLHWPNRGSYHFRKWHSFDPTGQDRTAPADITACLEALDAHVKAGRIRAIGLSNESAWGTMQFLNIAGANGLPRVASIQNEYSLLCRHYDLDLAELTHHEDVGLLAFSPLATGILTGKYLDGATPPGSRKSIGPELGGRLTDRVDAPLRAYLDLAREHGLDPVHLALAFCAQRPFMTSIIFGATTMDQLATALGAADITLSDEVLDGIAAIHRTFPIPM